MDRVHLVSFYKTTAWLLAGGIVRRISNDGELDIVIRNSLGPIRRSSGLTVSNSAVLGPFLHPGNLGDMEQSTWWCRKILNQCRTAPKDARMARSFNSWWTRNKRCWTAEANTWSYTCRKAILPWRQMTKSIEISCRAVDACSEPGSFCIVFVVTRKPPPGGGGADSVRA